MQEVLKRDTYQLIISIK